MTPETIFTFNISASQLIVGIIVFCLALLGIVWKGKGEIATTIKQEIDPLRRNTSNIVNAITEMQTILRQKFKGLRISCNLVESPGSPLGPTEYGASLIKDSGLENILNENKEFLRTKLSAALPSNYTEYDVQEKARDLLVTLKDDPMFNPVKSWVYANPIDIELILRAGGLWLRDDFLGVPRRINKKVDQDVGGD